VDGNRRRDGAGRRSGGDKVNDGLVSGGAHGGATFGGGGVYRWHLYRNIYAEGDRAPLHKGRVCFVMLNPSTADALADDPTIRKCKYFARAWGFRRLDVVNLFSYRATDPKELLRVGSPIGAETDRHIRAASYDSDMVVCAWGRLPTKLAHRQPAALRILGGRANGVHCLGLNNDLSPKHPLYLKNETQPKEWRT
jgi:hypothetical protein